MLPLGMMPPDYLYCIAGGYAACPAEASDVDVWVYGVTNLEVTRNDLVWHLEGEFGEDFIEEVENRSTETEYQITVNTRKVGRVQWIGQTYHILVTDAGQVLDLLDGFDISTHAVALLPSGQVVKGTFYTPTRVHPLILLDTPTTPERYRKICARFGHTPDSRIVAGSELVQEDNGFDI